MRENPFNTLNAVMCSTNTYRAYQDPIEFPKEIHVELTNRCNISCPFCPVGQHTIERKQGRMREDLFWAICTEVQEHGAVIKLIRWGEPTLHVRCFDFIRMATKIGIPVHMNTNGVNLNVQAVLDSGLDSIKISAHTKDAYESIQRLVKERGDRDKPYITVGLLSSEYSPYELPSVTADKFTIADTKDLNETGRAPKACYELYNRLSVDWDGTVVACCGAYDRQMALGHIYDKDTLKEIWDGENLAVYRKLEHEGKLNHIPLCSKCARGDLPR